LLPSAVVAAEANALPKLAPPYGEIPPTFWQQHHTAVILAGAVFLALATLAFYFILRPAKPANIPPGAAARQALAKWQNQPEDGLALSAISQILRHYTAGAFGVANGELTTAEFCAAINDSERLGSDLSSALASFLHECDVKKFSPAFASAPIHAVERALRLVDLAEARRISAQQASAHNPNTRK
jgi:hypothetical protein